MSAACAIAAAIEASGGGVAVLVVKDQPQGDVVFIQRAGCGDGMAVGEVAQNPLHRCGGGVAIEGDRELAAAVGVGANLGVRPTQGAIAQAQGATGFGG